MMLVVVSMIMGMVVVVGRNVREANAGGDLGPARGQGRQRPPIDVQALAHPVLGRQQHVPNVRLRQHEDLATRRRTHG